MCLITVYNDDTDMILFRYWYPDNQAMLERLYQYFKLNYHPYNIYFGVQHAALSLH